MELELEKSTIAFDGRVLERFGRGHVRVLVRRMTIKETPDRKGRITVLLSAHTIEIVLKIPAEQAAEYQEFAAALVEAGARRS